MNAELRQSYWLIVRGFEEELEADPSTIQDLQSLSAPSTLSMFGVRRPLLLSPNSHLTSALQPQSDFYPSSKKYSRSRIILFHRQKINTMFTIGNFYLD
ncbi:MAG: hypothetical protein RLY69_1175 [Verrucomicrobiota bacterium]